MAAGRRSCPRRAATGVRLPRRDGPEAQGHQHAPALRLVPAHGHPRHKARTERRPDMEGRPAHAVGLSGAFQRRHAPRPVRPHPATGHGPERHRGRPVELPPTRGPRQAPRSVPRRRASPSRRRGPLHPHRTARRHRRPTRAVPQPRLRPRPRPMTNAPALLVIHDIGDPRAGAAWDELVDAWPGPAMAPDLPGHGQTPPPIGASYALPDAAVYAWRAAESDGIPDRDVVVLGHTSAGFAAELLAAGGRASKLVLVDGLGPPWLTFDEIVA